MAKTSGLMRSISHINNKIQQFMRAGYGERYKGEVSKIVGGKDILTKSGNLTTSKKRLATLTPAETNDILNSLQNLQHSKTIGTVKKYEDLIEQRATVMDDWLQSKSGLDKDIVGKYGDTYWKNVEFARAMADKKGQIVNSDQVLLDAMAMTMLEVDPNVNDADINIILNTMDKFEGKRQREKMRNIKRATRGSNRGGNF